jgi:hypothetical protein
MLGGAALDRAENGAALGRGAQPAGAQHLTGSI